MISVRSGSSPLTRGKPHIYTSLSATSRLIPAHAGKTRLSVAIPTKNPAHPRSRGENQTGFPLIWNPSGSSPLTRGKPCRRRRHDTRHRLIPAHAGKTARHADGLPLPEAHPRSRGENMHSPCLRRKPSGSSPLTRGKPLSLMMCISVFRLIPAHAGKTQFSVI